ncbi:MAG: T9SS type A sorting domain-containing protein [Ignavibacteria bacterium]
MRPRNPSISTAGSPSATVLKLVINFTAGGTGYILTNNGYPGTKIVRMRLRSKVGSLNNVPPDLRWRNPPVATFATKIFAYVGTSNTDITTPTTHLIDPINVLPVELSSFISIVNKNKVTLNWTTTSEENNSGFSVEKSMVNGEWAIVGFVNGHGNTSSSVNYTFEDKSLLSGKYRYRLKQIDYNGNFKYYELQNEVTIGTPEKFFLSQNYPNPFNPVTKINYELPKDGNVTLKIFDNTGKEVLTIINEFKPAGYYSTEFIGSNLSSGIYYYILKANNFSDTKRMILLK